MKHWYVMAVRNDCVATIASDLAALKRGVYIALKHERHVGGFVISRQRFPGYVIGRLDLELDEHLAIYRMTGFDYILPRYGAPSALPPTWFPDLRAHITAEFFRAARAPVVSEKIRPGDIVTITDPGEPTDGLVGEVMSMQATTAKSLVGMVIWQVSLVRLKKIAADDYEESLRA